MPSQKRVTLFLLPFAVVQFLRLPRAPKRGCLGRQRKGSVPSLTPFLSCGTPRVAARDRAGARNPWLALGPRLWLFTEQGHL